MDRLKFKLIQSNYSDDFEKELNKFLLTDVRIHTRDFSTTGRESGQVHYSVLIGYKEIPVTPTLINEFKS